MRPTSEPRKMHNQPEVKMIRKLSSVFLVCGLLAMAGCGSREFQDFTSAEGKFKVQFPGKPKESSQPAPAGATMKSFAVEERNGVFVVSYGDMPFPENEPDAKVQDRLEGAVLGSVQATGGKLTSKT